MDGSTDTYRDRERRRENQKSPNASRNSINEIPPEKQTDNNQEEEQRRAAELREEGERATRRAARMHKKQQLDQFRHFIADREPLELIQLMDREGLVTDCSEKSRHDRLCRFLLRITYGPTAAKWSRKDYRGSATPTTTYGLLNDPSFVGLPEQHKRNADPGIRAAYTAFAKKRGYTVAFDSDREEVEERPTSPESPIRNQETATQTETARRRERVSAPTEDTRAEAQFLQSGQTMGRWQDPVALSMLAEQLATFIYSASGHSNLPLTPDQTSRDLESAQNPANAGNMTLPGAPIGRSTAKRPIGGQSEENTQKATGARRKTVSSKRSELNVNFADTTRTLQRPEDDETPRSSRAIRNYAEKSISAPQTTQSRQKTNQAMVPEQRPIQQPITGFENLRISINPAGKRTVFERHNFQTGSQWGAQANEIEQEFQHQLARRYGQQVDSETCSRRSSTSDSYRQNREYKDASSQTETDDTDTRHRHKADNRHKDKRQTKHKTLRDSYADSDSETDSSRTRSHSRVPQKKTRRPETRKDNRKSTKRDEHRRRHDDRQYDTDSTADSSASEYRSRSSRRVNTRDNRRSSRDRGHRKIIGTGVFDALRRCNIKFENSRLHDPELFLRQLEQCRKGAGIRQRDFFAGLSCAFVGVAATWYSIEGHRYRTRDEFCDAFRRQFIGVNAQAHLAREAQRRTQREQESCAEYLIHLRSIFVMMSKPPALDEQLDMAYNGLRPIYREYFFRDSFASYEGLQTKAEQVEENWKISQRHVQRGGIKPGRNPVAAVEEDWAVVTKKKKAQSPLPSPKPERKSKEKARGSKTPKKTAHATAALEDEARSPRKQSYNRNNTDQGNGSYRNDNRRDVNYRNEDRNGNSRSYYNNNNDYRDSRNYRGNNYAPSRRPYQSSHDRPNYRNGQYNRNAPNVSRTPGQLFYEEIRENSKCYMCSGRGHWARECPTVSLKWMRLREQPRSPSPQERQRQEVWNPRPSASQGCTVTTATGIRPTAVQAPSYEFPRPPVTYAQATATGTIPKATRDGTFYPGNGQ